MNAFESPCKAQNFQCSNAQLSAFNVWYALMAFGIWNWFIKCVEWRLVYKNNGSIVFHVHYSSGDLWPQIDQCNFCVATWFKGISLEKPSSKHFIFSAVCLSFIKLFCCISLLNFHHSLSQYMEGSRKT